MTSATLILHAAATWAMTGLIWFVQVVHYPLFARVGADGFADYETAHAARTTWVVAPLMIAEAATALWLALARPPGVRAEAAWLGLGLVVVIWGSTAFLQVPRHSELAAGFSVEAHRALVATNWARTVAWSVRAGLAAWLLRVPSS